jgi:hypothetical protein
LTQLLNREQTRADFAYLRSVFKDTKSTGLKYIEVPDPDNPSKSIEIYDPSEMTKYLLKRNQKHFGQANNTPFTSDPLKSIYEYNGTNKNSKDLIIDRVFPNEIKDLEESTKQFLEMLASNKQIPHIADTITYEEFKMGISKWKERTTTSPSGRHLGHYKLLL